jgi:hypothetical protein
MKEEAPKEPIHPKIQEYITRINGGESKDAILKDLPEGMKNAVIEGLQSKKVSDEKENPIHENEYKVENKSETTEADQKRLKELKQELGIENVLDNPSLQLAKKKILHELDFAQQKGKPIDFKLVSKLLMEGLTHRNNYAEMVEKDEFALSNGFAEEKKSYRAKMENLVKNVMASGMQYDGNPAWFGINTVPEKVKTREINRKFYASLETGNLDFIDHIKDLASDLRTLALDTDDIIQVKIPGGFGGFLAHRDSVVIHFKDPDNAEAVEKVFDTWKDKFSINEGERELGRTQLAADSKETSFSDLVATAMTNYFKDNLGKYDTNELLDKTLEHAAELSKKGPTIEKK